MLLLGSLEGLAATFGEDGKVVAPLWTLGGLAAEDWGGDGRSLDRWKASSNGKRGWQLFEPLGLSLIHI